MSVWDRNADENLLFSGEMPSTVFLDVETGLLYNAGIITSTRDRPARKSLPLTAQEEVQHGRPPWTATWQLPPGHPAGTGRLCRSLSRAACALQAASGHQGAAYPLEWPRS